MSRVGACTLGSASSDRSGRPPREMSALTMPGAGAEARNREVCYRSGTRAPVERGDDPVAQPSDVEPILERPQVHRLLGTGEQVEQKRGKPPRSSV